VPGINGVPSLLNNGGGSGTTHELQTDPSGLIGSVGPLMPVKDSTGPLGSGALTPGIIGKSIPGILVGLPSLFVSAVATGASKPNTTAIATSTLIKIFMLTIVIDRLPLSNIK
jgi:hypothetical protein